MTRTEENQKFCLFFGVFLLFIAIIFALLVIIPANDKTEKTQETTDCVLSEKTLTDEQQEQYWTKQAHSNELDTNNEIYYTITTTTNYKYPPIDISSGVYFYGGMRCTYYSSCVAPHCMQSNWYTDERGFWRDSEGYFVIAYTMTLPYGTIIEIADGVYGKVLDHCPTQGVCDIFVSW